MLLLLSAVVLATPKHVGAGVIASKYLSVPAIAQEKSNWCWAASARAVLLFINGSADSQCILVSIIYPGCPNYTGSLTDVNQILNKYWVTGTWVNSSIAFSSITYHINNSHPEIARWGWDGGGGHMLTIRGYYRDDNIGQQDISYIDPGDGSYNYTSYSWFLRGGGHTWTDTLYDIHHV
jgi:hypothetical protein